MELKSRQDVEKALHDVHARVKELEERDGTLGSQTEKMVADIKDISQRLNELNAQVPEAHAGGSESELKQYVRNDGRLHVKSGVDDEGYYRKGLLDDAPVCEWQAKLQELTEQYTLVKAYSRQEPLQTRRDIKRHIECAPAAIKKIFYDTTNLGAEWIPDLMLPMLERTMVAQRRVEALFGVMPMTGKEQRIPFLTTSFRPYKKGTPTSDDPAQYSASSMATSQISVTATGLAVRGVVDDDASEDSILAALPLIQQELVTSLVDGVEDAICNGDSAATHQDTGLAGWNIRSRWGASGLGGTDDHRRVWIGLRAKATDVSNTTDQSSAQTYTGFVTARGKLASPHGVAGDLVCVVSPEYYLKMSNFTEVVTVDKFGPNAFILSGQLASLGGVPIIVSEFVDAQYNASGVYDNSTKTKTGFLLFNRARFKMGVLRGPSVELDKDITRGVHNVVATTRKVFFSLNSTAKDVHWSYNLTP